MKPQTYHAWAVQWRSGPNNLDRKRIEHLVTDYRLPVIVADGRIAPAVFPTRDAARAWVKERYATWFARRDLRKYPHDWRMPRVVRITITMELCK